MSANAFDIRQDQNGTWSIVDVETEHVVVIVDKPQNNLAWLEATYLALLMNRRAEKQGRTSAKAPERPPSPGRL